MQREERKESMKAMPHHHFTAAQRGIVNAGLDWIYQTEQPDNALAHHGVYSPHVDGRQFRFIGAGWDESPVVVVDVAEPEYAGQELTNPLREGELAALAQYIYEQGHPVKKTWNGAGVTGSIGLLFPAHHTLVAAHDRYLASCPQHGTVFCYRDGCRWNQEGSDALLAPGWG